MSTEKTPGIVRRVWRWIRRGLVVVAVLAVVAAGLGWIVQSLASARDARRFPAPGALVDVGGRSLHLDCKGEGTPTVVIDAGAQDWSTGWQRPQAALAEHTRVCTYDRAGMGWSDPSDDPKDGLHMVADLKSLLDAADVERPVVLAGHSLGGMLNRIYYQQYPDEVAGMVLLEPGDPDEIEAMFKDSDGGPAFGSWVDTLASAAARVGVVRFLFRDLFEGKGYPADEVAVTRARLARPAATRALASTVRHLPVTAQQTRDNRDLGDIPLRVVYSSRFDEVGTSFESEQERREFIAASIAAWNALRKLSTRGREPVMVDGANHVSLVRDDRYWPQAIAVILDVVEEVRSLAEPKALEEAAPIS
jgi:pimeloyl-ACP methyl ester carboxylesterase